MHSWKLDDAVELQKEFPYTYYRPCNAIIDALKPGNAIVKLVFLFEREEADLPNAERMWVIMDKINEDGSYTGTLDNDPYYIKDLKAGDAIRFEKKHIIQYDVIEELDVVDTNSGVVEQYLKKCLVSNHIMNDGYKVGRFYREESEDEEYTGWTFLSDYETQEYVDDYTNLQYISIGKVLNLDDSFLHLLNEPVGAEYARDEITGTFFLLED